MCSAWLLWAGRDVSAQTAPAATGVESDAEPQAQAGFVLTKAPELLHFVEAQFPQGQGDKASAQVLLEVLIDATGSVQDARVVESAGAAFDAAALEAVRGFKFSPAEVNGAPAAIKIQYRYEFKAEPTTLGPTRLQGAVFVRGTGQPLANVNVRLDTGERAVTDEQGRFQFETVQPGERTLLLWGNQLSALQTSETLKQGVQLEVRYEVSLQPVASETTAADIDDLEVVIVAPKATLEVVATRVEADSARRVAGTQGDVLKVVENMPGVARAAAGSGDVVVWGAAPEDTRVYVDGVRVPALYHFGGFRSVMHSDLVQHVELIPGAYGAAYGRGLGGLVSVQTKKPADQDLQGSVQLDVLDASVAASAPVSTTTSVSIAARRSHLHNVLPKRDRNSGFFPIPEYYDGSARLRHQVNTEVALEVGGLLSQDEVTRSAGTADPLAKREETKRLGFDRIFMRLLAEGDDGARTQVVPWFGRDRTRLSGVFGQVPVGVRGDLNLYGLRASWLGAASKHVTAHVGLDVEVVQAEYRRQGAMSAPARQGDARVFGQAPADQVNSDRWKAVTGSAAPYAEVDIALFDGSLHALPGLRVEPFFASVNRRRPVDTGASVGAFDADASVQPRLSLRYSVHPALTLKAAYGRYRQPAPAEDLSSVFGNPLLGTASATHYLFAADTKFTSALGAQTTLFYSRSEDLAVRNPLPSPRVGEALLAQGEGRAFGMQLLLSGDTKKGLFGWIAYTLQRSERRDSAFAAWHLFDFDQTHVLTALVSYEAGLGWEFGARGRVASGAPRTPVLGAYYDARRDQFEPLLGELNTDRIPTFWQIDVRVSKHWKLGGTELETYLDVLNVTDRENPEELVYSSDYSERRFINGLPLLPVLGAKWSF